jgi:hypothetical protein
VFLGPPAIVPAPDAALAKDPDVIRASKSVVRVTGIACGLGIEGSGWMARRGLVVTNAHVVGRFRSLHLRRAGQPRGVVSLHQKRQMINARLEANLPDSWRIGVMRSPPPSLPWRSAVWKLAADDPDQVLPATGRACPAGAVFGDQNATLKWLRGADQTPFRRHEVAGGEAPGDAAALVAKQRSGGTSPAGGEKNTAEQFFFIFPKGAS